jgi:dTDP-4-dehydrorhamnose reductase
MRILITGVSGQVGSALVAQLHDHEVVAADHLTIDLAQPNDILGTLEKIDPAIIINAAAYTAVDRAEQQRELATVVNAIAPGVMARWAAGRGVPLIHFSTDYVFDGSGETPWHEKDATGPLSVYGATKLAGERAVQAAGGISLIVRTSWVYAATGKNFLRTIARLAREQRELRIVADQIGAPTSAALIAGSLACMLAGDIDIFRDRCAQCDGIVHLTAAGETSWHGFADAIVEGLRARRVPLAVEKIVPIGTEDYPTPARRPHNSRLDLTTLRQLFEITPAHWRDALESELDALARELWDAVNGESAESEWARVYEKGINQNAS